MNKELNISWCYPDMLNLHGDRGNLMALKKVGELLGLEVKIDKIETFEQKIDFENTDILLFNPGELKTVETIIEQLGKQREGLEKYIENDKVVIVIGTTGAVFAKKVTRLEGKEIEGLGFLDMNCTEREMVYGDDIIYTMIDDEDTKIVGSQIQIIDTKLNSNIAFGKVKYGRGNNGDESNEEGAKYKNLIFTNALGPVLVKNPWLTEKIIKTAIKQKGVELTENIEDSQFEIERKSLECIEAFHKKYKD